MENKAYEDIEANQAKVSTQDSFDPYKTFSRTKQISSSTGFNKDYLKSLQGTLRLCLILSLVACFIAASTIDVSAINLKTLNDLKISFLVFTIIGFVISIAIYILTLFNLLTNGSLIRINWNICYLILDVVFSIPIFILTILCIIQAENLSIASIIDLKTKFAVCSTFGLISVISYVIVIFYNLIHLLNLRN